MSIDLIVSKTDKPRKVVQMDYLNAYRTYRTVEKLSPKAAYYSAYAKLITNYKRVDQ
jgi:hypothetical protein